MCFLRIHKPKINTAKNHLSNLSESRNISKLPPLASTYNTYLMSWIRETLRVGNITPESDFLLSGPRATM